MKNKDLVEKALRIAVRKMLVKEASVKAQTPVSMELGTKLFNDLKQHALKGSLKMVTPAVREAIRQLKNGDRADQKFADNLRAYQGSVKSGHPKWVIAELAFAEWQHRRKINPVVATTGTIPESKKTQLEKMYENIVEFAAQNGREPFSVLDDMMAVAEKETLPVQIGGQEPLIAPGGPTPVEIACDSGFDHGDVRINNPLYDPAGKEEVHPPTFYGDSFMNSKFPFAHGDHFIVDPRYNETGEQEVDPLEYYGDSIKGSAYMSVFKK